MEKKNEMCAIVEDLLPIYIEELASPQVEKFVSKHIDSCEECEKLYKKAKMNLKIISDAPEADKKTLSYVNYIKLWYFVCPALAFLFTFYRWNMLLYYYEGFLILVAVACILSDLYHRSTSWWDPECTDLQIETRIDAKKKWHVFYIRPILLGLPALIIILILELPKIINW